MTVIFLDFIMFLNQRWRNFPHVLTMVSGYDLFKTLERL